MQGIPRLVNLVVTTKGGLDSKQAFEAVKAFLEKAKGLMEECGLQEVQIPTTYGGFHEHELVEAFDRVKHPKSWKDRISGIIEESQVDATVAAIKYYAYGGATCTKQKNGKVLVTAPGYWAMEAR